MKNFEVFLRTEDQLIFEDLMNQCKLYASYASNLASPIKEFPLLLSMLFAHHKMLWEHHMYITAQKNLTNKTDTPETSDPSKIDNVSKMPMLHSTRY